MCLHLKFVANSFYFFIYDININRKRLVAEFLPKDTNINNDDDDEYSKEYKRFYTNYMNTIVQYVQ